MLGRNSVLLLSITIIAVTADNKCNNPSDISSWSTNGGQTNRPTHSNYCSRTYNGGCFLNANCIENCFQEVYGYSEECSSCFGKIPQCSINSGCMMVCMRDSLGAECAKCNEQCVAEFDVCTGFSDLEEEVAAVNEEDEVVEEDEYTIDIEDTMPISEIYMMSLPTTESLSDDEPNRRHYNRRLRRRGH